MSMQVWIQFRTRIQGFEILQLKIKIFDQKKQFIYRLGHYEGPPSQQVSP
jgi:hypothetical protein